MHRFSDLLGLDDRLPHRRSNALMEETCVSRTVPSIHLISSLIPVLLRDENVSRSIGKGWLDTVVSLRAAT